MATCKNCSNPIELKQGRRPREFCDNNQKCRNEWFRKNKKAKETVTIPMGKWKEIQEFLGGAKPVSAQFFEHDPKAGIISPPTSSPVSGKSVTVTIKAENHFTHKPPKLAGESALDYRIRCEELAKLKSTTT